MIQAYHAVIVNHRLTNQFKLQDFQLDTVFYEACKKIGPNGDPFEFQDVLRKLL